jgi:hypothetical protein
VLLVEREKDGVCVIVLVVLAEAVEVREEALERVVVRKGEAVSVDEPVALEEPLAEALALALALALRLLVSVESSCRRRPGGGASS